MRRTPSPATQTLKLSDVLETAESVSPDAFLEGLFFGSGPNALLTVYMAHGHLGDYARTDFVYFDQQRGKLLYTWRRGRNATLGDWVLWLFVPLHFGTSWGLAGKLVWFALGLVLPILVVTGVLMYWNRWFATAGLSCGDQRVGLGGITRKSQVTWCVTPPVLVQVLLPDTVLSW